MKEFILCINYDFRNADTSLNSDANSLACQFIESLCKKHGYEYETDDCDREVTVYLENDSQGQIFFDLIENIPLLKKNAIFWEVNTDRGINTYTDWAKDE